MAPLSPRRSSRARATNSQSQQSSGSSSTSSRHERATRSVNKPSSIKSTPSASLSSEPPEDFDDTLLGRRRRRGHDDDADKIPRFDSLDMATGSDDLLEEEDEAVRCICGSEDYPGRPPVEGPDADFFAATELSDDVTGFFVQCDICKVWQHGACVGIFSAESSPDEYFCEQCRKDLHKIHTASNGQKYSKYAPLHRPARTASRSASIAKETARSPRNSSTKTSRLPPATQTSKRRSTMNSRDRAYEDEQLLRAIEASKEDAPNSKPETSTTSTTRRAKRGRSESDDSTSTDNIPLALKYGSLRHPQGIKRQRTSSRSTSPLQAPAIDVFDQDDDEEEPIINSIMRKPRHLKSMRERFAEKTKVETLETKDDTDMVDLEEAAKETQRALERTSDAVGPEKVVHAENEGAESAQSEALSRPSEKSQAAGGAKNVDKGDGANNNTEIIEEVGDLRNAESALASEIVEKPESAYGAKDTASERNPNDPEDEDTGKDAKVQENGKDLDATGETGDNADMEEVADVEDTDDAEKAAEADRLSTTRRTDKDDKSKQRQEPANKRKGRNDRRREEDSDFSEELHQVAAGTPISESVEVPIYQERMEEPTPVPESPQAHTAPTTTHKRAARHHKKGKGRNQYTRDRDLDSSRSPGRSMSRDLHKTGEEGGHSRSDHHRHGKRAAAPKLSMMDMKRRVGAIMDFISRTQVDLAAESNPGSLFDSGESSPWHTPMHHPNVPTDKQADVPREDTPPDSSHPKEFKDLSCMEMMDVLTRDMVKWQNQYA